MRCGNAPRCDGPFLAWCKYVQNIDVLVPVPGDRDIHQDMEGLAAGGLLKFQQFSYVCTIQRHKRRRSEVVVASVVPSRVMVPAT